MEYAEMIDVDRLLRSFKPNPQTLSLKPAGVAPRAARQTLNSRCQTNVEHVRQSRPYSGLFFQAESRKTLKLFPLRSKAER